LGTQKVWPQRSHHSLAHDRNGGNPTALREFHVDELFLLPQFRLHSVAKMHYGPTWAAKNNSLAAQQDKRAKNVPVRHRCRSPLLMPQ
jgi:hypothetical protein